VRIGRWILLALVLAGAGYIAFRKFSHKDVTLIAPVAGSADASAPPGVRIKVEVLNATLTKGLARRATTYLRDRGFDVLESGTYKKQLDRTVVLDRSNHPEWAKLVAEAFAGTVQEKPDTSRYLDVTVLVGANWRPPPLPFYP
jgi:hypothetical protein